MKKSKILAILMITLIICTIPMTVFAATHMRADINSDGKVNSADAIYLLRHTIMSDKYPIANAGDMNGDGRINSADAIYLLRHTIMPDKYPIKSECVHNEVIDLGINATCAKIGLTEGKHCSICGTVFQKQEIISKLDHIMNNGECVDCGYVSIDYSDLDLYDSTYGFEYLGTLPKGQSLQEFYKRLDSVAKAFHADTTIDAPISSLNCKGELEKVIYKDIGLSYEDAVMTFSIFKKDHPVYYWLSNDWIYNTEVGWLILNVDLMYVKGTDRAYYNKLVYDAIKSYTSIVQGETSPYLITLAYHDAILSSVEYAYEEDGKTPVSAIWAHSIMGVFDKKGVVCEGYAKTLQLLLNFSGVKNILVDGNENAPHSWNLICLDDGEWYWCDATWNDSDNYLGDINYNNFCVNDTQYVNWSDELLGWNKPILGSDSFIDSHTPFDLSAEDDWRKQYALPERAPYAFDNDSLLELREPFTIGDYTYALAGYNKVQLVSVKNQNVLIIPEYVVYDDTVYQVTSIGSMLDNGFFTANDSISRNVMAKIIMPSSIEYIWGYALSMDNTIIYYGDTVENWEKLHKNNHVFNDVKIYYYSETMPEENDKFWHYYKGEVTVWQYHQHVEAIDPPISPSCTENGLTEGKHCSICDEIIVKQEIIPVTEHTYENGQCVCGKLQPTADQYFTFTLLENGTYSIATKDVNNMPENVVIPETYDGKIVSSIADRAFHGCTGIMNIYIPETIIDIGHDAFFFCNKLQNIIIPKNVTTIKANTFNECWALESVVLPNNLKSIESCAFTHCMSLKQINIPDNVTQIGSSAFSGCNMLTKIILPQGIKIIESGTFAFSGLTNIVIPETVVRIEEGSFTNSNLTYIDIPEGVIFIGNEAFAFCNLTYISLPKSIVSIGSFAFNYSRELSNIFIAENNPYYSSEGNCLMEKSTKTVLLGCTNSVIPNYAVNIAPSAFSSSNIVEIVIPNSVVFIGNQAFNGCKELNEVTIGNNVNIIEDSAFSQCSKLKKITIPNSVTVIGTQVFYNCDMLENITIGYHVDSIGSNLIDYTAYYNNKENWEGDVLYINNYLIAAKTSLSGDYIIKNDTKLIADGAFYGLKSLSGITIPDTVIHIGSYAFSECSALVNVRISNNVTSMNPYVFNRCRNLTNIILPDSIIKIDSCAFSECSNLNSIVISNRVTDIKSMAFSQCDSLKHIYYVGAPNEWDQIHIDWWNNVGLSNALRYYYSHYHPTNNCTAYWHYENDTPTIWGHNEVVSTGVPATCTESGLTNGTYCLYCSTVIVPQNTIPATGHNKMDMPMVVPTCTTNGSIGGVYCSICNKIFEEPYIRPAYGHRIVSEGASDPTYTNGGMTAKEYCSRCGLVFKEQENIPVKVGDFSLFIDDPYHYADQNLMICDKNKTYEILIYDKNYDQYISISETPNLSLEISATSATITESGLLSFTAGCSDYLYLKCGDEIIDSIEIYSPNDFSRVNADFMKNQSEMFIDSFCPNNQLKVFNYQSKQDYSKSKITVSFDVYNTSPVIYGVVSCYSDGRIYDLQYIDGYWINYSISEIITETLFIGLPDLLTGKYWAGESAFQSQKTSINMDVPAGGYIQLVSFKDNENVRMANIAQYIVCVYQTTEDAMELLDNSSEVLFKNFDIYKCVDILSKLPEPQKIAIETAFNTVHWKDACTAFFQLLASGEIDHTIIKQMFTYGLKDTFVDIALSLAESAENALLKKYCPIAYTVVNGIDAIGDCAQLAIFGKQIQAINNTDSFLYESGFQFWYPNYGEW